MIFYMIQTQKWKLKLKFFCLLKNLILAYKEVNLHEN
jgi:hypothetical protein